MDDKEIERIEKALREGTPEPELIGEVVPDKSMAEFCIDGVKRMMISGGSPRSSFHVMHAGSVYYIDMIIRAIAPPFEARDTRLDERQWFGQRET